MSYHLRLPTTRAVLNGHPRTRAGFGEARTIGDSGSLFRAAAEEMKGRVGRSHGVRNVLTQ